MPPGQPLQLRPLCGRGPGAAGTDAVAVGSEWGICLTAFWDVAGVVERTGEAGEARLPALLWLIQEPPSLQEAAPKKNLHLWESLSPFKDDVPSEIIHPSIHLSIHEHLEKILHPCQEPPLPLRASMCPRTCIPLKASTFQKSLFPLSASSPLRTSIL